MYSSVVGQLQRGNPQTRRTDNGLFSGAGLEVAEVGKLRWTYSTSQAKKHGRCSLQLLNFIPKKSEGGE